MIIRKQKPFEAGYTPITTLNGPMLLDFGILKLRKGEAATCSFDLERAWMVIKGEVRFSWEGKEAVGKRTSCIDEPPVVLHAPRRTAVMVEALEDSELAVERCVNDQVFPVRFYAQGEVKTEIFGAGVLNEASNRTVRTVFDGESAPYSNMVMGEVINHPGRWSSYPPH
ncbi:MAG: 5-deoxy-glucuronate isomerase, partial [Spirochaetales bacterium]|nr:5-deoxy-glucuronate isomerase [Spirochaetales bacterium]